MHLGSYPRSLALLCAAAAAPAQSPPPTGATSTVGLSNQSQLGGPFGEQRIGAICAAPFFGPTATIGAGGVVPGGSIAWWSEALHPTLQPLTYHTAGTAPVFFLVAPFTFGSLLLPFAAPLHNRVFLPPAATVVAAAPWILPQASGGIGAVVPTGGFDRWFLTLDIPNQPSLLGSVWAAQAVRIDPSDLLLYFSDEHLVQVAN
jgi:hypothetical protein